jgi:hypothetical protein
MMRTVCAGGVLALSLLVAVSAGAGERSDLPVDARPCRPGSALLPPGVNAEKALIPSLQRMLRRSRTFRRQCERLAEAPWVHIRIRFDLRLHNDHAYRAVSVIQRPMPNLLLAVVAIQPTADPVQWVSHEFEHVIEQMDGVNVESLAERYYRHAWRSGSGMFETLRAIKAGELLLDEMHAFGQSDNFVEESMDR